MRRTIVLRTKRARKIKGLSLKRVNVKKRRRSSSSVAKKGFFWKWW